MSTTKKQSYATKETTRTVSDFIASDIQPLSLVERDAFLKMMDVFRTDLKMPCRKTLIKDIQVGLYKKV